MNIDDGLKAHSPALPEKFYFNASKPAEFYHVERSLGMSVVKKEDKSPLSEVLKKMKGVRETLKKQNADNKTQESVIQLSNSLENIRDRFHKWQHKGSRISVIWKRVIYFGISKQIKKEIKETNALKKEIRLDPVSEDRQNKLVNAKNFIDQRTLILNNNPDKVVQETINNLESIIKDSKSTNISDLSSQELINIYEEFFINYVFNDNNLSEFTLRNIMNIAQIDKLLEKPEVLAKMPKLVTTIYTVLLLTENNSSTPSHSHLIAKMNDFIDANEALKDKVLIYKYFKNKAPVTAINSTPAEFKTIDQVWSKIQPNQVHILVDRENVDKWSRLINGHMPIMQSASTNQGGYLHLVETDRDKMLTPENKIYLKNRLNNVINHTTYTNAWKTV